MSLSPEEAALFGDTAPAADDDWGFGDAPAAPAASFIKDESTGPDGAAGIAARDAAKRTAKDAKVGETVSVPALGEVTITNRNTQGTVAKTSDGRLVALHDTTEAALVIPPDAPANSKDVPPPGKATRKKKETVDIQPEGKLINYVSETRPQVVELGPESRALLEKILAALTVIP